MLIPQINFVIPGKFDDMVNYKAPLFVVLPKVIPESKKVPYAKIIIL